MNQVRLRANEACSCCCFSFCRCGNHLQTDSFSLNSIGNFKSHLYCHHQRDIYISLVRKRIHNREVFYAFNFVLPTVTTRITKMCLRQIAEKDYRPSPPLQLKAQFITEQHSRKTSNISSYCAGAQSFCRRFTGF